MFMVVVVVCVCVCICVSVCLELDFWPVHVVRARRAGAEAREQTTGGMTDRMLVAWRRGETDVRSMTHVTVEHGSSVVLRLRSPE